MLQKRAKILLDEIATEVQGKNFSKRTKGIAVSYHLNDKKN